MFFDFQSSIDEKQLLSDLVNICKSDNCITNLFVFGSRVQHSSYCDKYSDLDVIILVKKSLDILFLDLSKVVYFEAIEKNKYFIHYNYVLADFHRGNIFVIAEENFKKTLKNNPFIWGSAICKGINKLVAKNTLLDCVSKTKIKEPNLRELVTNIYGKIIYDFICLLCMKLRGENSQTYFYSHALHNDCEELITTKLQYSDYCYYKSNNLSVMQLLSSYEGRHFEKYASQRQKDIMELLYCATSISKEKMIDLLNHIYDELKECAELCSVTIDFQPLEDLKIYTSSQVLNTKDWEKYIKNKKLIREEQCKIIDLFVRA